MNVLNAKKGNTVVKRQDKVMEWYLIQSGSVIRRFNMAEVELGPNSIIGILEHEWFSCDYVAKEDTTLIVIPCKNAKDLGDMLKAHENFRPIFLRTALEQRQEMLSLYDSLLKKCTLLHACAEEYYNDYQQLCAEFVVREQEFGKMERFEAVTINHKAEDWEIANSASLVKGYLKEYMQLMIRDDGMCVGAIMEASAQVRRVTQGIGELATYLRFNREILANDNEDDIFHLFFNLAASQSSKPDNVETCRKKMLSLLDTLRELDIYNPDLLVECERECTNNSFGEVKEGRINLEKEDCVSYILEYAGYDKTESRDFKATLKEFKELPDMGSTDDRPRTLRKTLSKAFYDIYTKAFIRSLEDEQRPTPILSMFFNFGFMDTELVGLSNATSLLGMANSLELFHSEHVYTIYDWLLRIYNGEAEPSRNEFDLDYNGYLAEQKKSGEITDEEMKALKKDQLKKVEFEITNMFQSGHRITYGRITTFCPIMTSADIINSLEKMALTADALEASVNRIRQIDYSVFYREIGFSDSSKGLNQEWLMHEILPDIVLMPGVGTKAMMWQETASVKNDTPARFLFPLFTAVNLEDQMIATIARYRWEICRKIQGIYWNDYREKSLTSEYCDYLQFYRKNRELSSDAKDKLALALQHCRNNFREVFVNDYTMWLKYESNGSFRLNKLTRGFLISYCPFSREIREKLKTNPTYQTAFNKLDNENAKKAARFSAVYAKYEAAGGEISDLMKENLRYYQM